MKLGSLPSPYAQPSLETIEAYYTGMRRFWHPVLPAAELTEGRVCGVQLLEEKLVLARLNGQLAAMQDLCRHFQAQLSLGEVRRVGAAGDCIACHYHGWAYDATGRCVEIPQLIAGREIPAEARVPVYRIQERHELIWVCLSDAPLYDIPEFPELSDARYRAGPVRTYPPWAAAAPRVMMGTLDDTHFPWVHEGLLGNRARAEPPDHRVWREGRCLRVEYTTQQPPNLFVDAGAADEGAMFAQDVDYSYYVAVPNVLRLITNHRPVRSGGKEIAAGHTLVIWLSTCPQAYNQTKSFWRLARDFDRDPDHDNIYETFEDRVREQDRPMVESQRPWLLPPFWTKTELPLRPADLPLIEYQRWLEELGIAVAV